MLSLKLAAALLALAPIAHAEIHALEGNYRLLSPCQLATQSTTAFLPAGEIRVVEGVPVRDLNERYSAILLQAEQVGEPVLTLGIGTVSHFQFRAAPTEVGTYLGAGHFVEQYYDLVNGAILQKGSIRVERQASGLQITSEDPLNRATSVCQLQAI